MKGFISRFSQHWLMTALSLLMGAAAGAQTVSLEEVLRQSSGIDTGYYPYGVPPSYSWYNGDVLPLGAFPPPANFTSLTGWGQFYPMVGYPNPACNIYVKDFQVYVHKKSGGWVSAQSGATLAGGNFVADFVGNQAYALNIEHLADGSKRMASPPYGRVAHWWPTARGVYQPNTIDGAFGIYAARVDDPNCNMIADYGIDYWRDPSAPWLADFSNNPAYGGGSWVKLTTNYQYIYYTRFTREQLMADPPPPLVGKLGAGTGTPSPTPTPTPTPTTPTAPSTTLKAPVAIEGQFDFAQNGSVSRDVQFNAGDYQIAITAYGTALSGVDPVMQVLIDGQVAASIPVDSTVPKEFTVSSRSFSAGVHKIAVAFVNDGYSAGVGDRNLYVRKIDIQSAGTATPVPATPAVISPSILIGTQMPLHTMGAAQGDYYNLWSNGTLSQMVNFSASGNFKIEVEGFGTPAGGVYPIMQILVDDRVVGTVTMGSTVLGLYSVQVQIPSGQHKIGVGFTNDAVINGQDRNLYVRRILLSGI